jgi:hypothetical protein
MTAESLLAVALGPGTNSIANVLGVNLNRAATGALSIWIAAVWIAAILGLWRSGISRREVILLVYVLYLLLASAGPEGYSRMRVPAMLAIALLIGALEPRRPGKRRFASCRGVRRQKSPHKTSFFDQELS